MTMQYAERPYENGALIRKAFAHYLAKGETSLELKTALLSREEGRAGCLIPTLVRENIDALLRQLCPMRALAHIDTTTSEAFEVVVDRSFAEASWAPEKEMTESKDVEFEKLRIPTHSVYVRPKATQRFLEDAGDNVETWFVTKIAQKMAAAENKAFLHGNGEGQPKGILTYPLVPVGQGKPGKIEAVTCTDEKIDNLRDGLLATTAALKAEYHPGAAWLISRSAMTTLQKITDPIGHYIWQSSLAQREPPTLLGYPVYISDDMPPLKDEAESTSILFGNFDEAYHIVDRTEMNVLRDPYTVKPYVEFFASKRVGGDLVNSDALKALTRQHKTG